MIDPQIMSIERLMEQNPDAVCHNDLNPTRTLDTKAICQGKLVPLCISVWCNGVETDYHVSTVLYQGPEADEQVNARYVYDGGKGVWMHDVELGSLLNSDPAWQDEEKHQAELEPHDFRELEMLLASARVMPLPMLAR